MSLQDAHGGRQQHKIIKSNLPDLVNLFNMEGEWRARDTPGGPRSQRLKTYVENGLIRVVRKESKRGTTYKVYEWDEAGRAAVRAHYEETPTLPCGCHGHIPSGRGDTPEGTMQCKYCDAVHARHVFGDSV